MTLTELTWLALAAYGIHILEEFTLDWRNWARNVLKLPAEWDHFYVTNALVIVLGAVAAELAATRPVIALGFAALMIINATFFHVLPFILAKGRFSPGLITAVLLFYPLGIACFRVADAGPADIAAAFLIGAGLMASPVVLLVLRNKAYFHQDRA